MTPGRRYVRVDYHYTVQEVRKNKVELRLISSENIPIDVLTKLLSANFFNRFIQQLGLNNE